MSNRYINFLTSEMLMRAYAAGIFPMAESAHSLGLRWFDPPIRAIIPLDDQFHIPRRLARELRHEPYQITLNRAYSTVMQGCSESCAGRETTWINREILSLYTDLHHRGRAHSIEVWQHDRLVGGLYGVSLGSAFFGESMFSREKNASKIALVHLVVLLRHCRYNMLDTQFQTPHLAQFGTFEITRSAYHLMLAAAIKDQSLPFPSEPNWHHLLGEALSRQPVTQIS